MAGNAEPAENSAWSSHGPCPRSDTLTQELTFETRSSSPERRGPAANGLCSRRSGCGSTHLPNRRDQLLGTAAIGQRHLIVGQSDSARATVVEFHRWMDSPTVRRARSTAGGLSTRGFPHCLGNRGLAHASSSAMLDSEVRRLAATSRMRPEHLTVREVGPRVDPMQQRQLTRLRPLSNQLPFRTGHRWRTRGTPNVHRRWSYRLTRSGFELNAAICQRCHDTNQVRD